MPYNNKISTILIVDDSTVNINIIMNILDGDYDLLVAKDGQSALEIVENEKIDLVLLDIVMPQMDGYEVCEKLKNNIKTKDIPIIFITAKTDEESIEKGFDIGGADYITKPFKAKELLARVKTQIKLQNLINHLEYISAYDKMTGVYNRGKFFELAQIMWQNEGNLYAIMLDIDKFKNINDTYGHPIGDVVIKSVAQEINKYTDEKSIFGRVGGEEFIFLTFEDSFLQVQEKAENFRKDIEKIKIDLGNNQIISCTISLGVAKKDERMKSLDDFFGEVDMALYSAKENGRNRVMFRQ